MREKFSGRTSLLAHRKPFYTVQMLNSRLNCDGLTLTCIGAGDDGRVLKVTDSSGGLCYAMKVYLKKSFAQIKDTISKDQAYRGLKH